MKNYEAKKSTNQGTIEKLMLSLIDESFALSNQLYQIGQAKVWHLKQLKFEAHKIRFKMFPS